MLFGKPAARRTCAMTRRFEGTARLVYCLLLLQKALRLRARTVYRTVTGSSPAAGAIESLGSPRLFYFIVLVARHDTPSSTGKSMAKTSPLLTSGRQVTVNSPMRGTVFPVSVWEYRANLTSRPWSGAWRSQSGSRGRWGPRRLRPGSRRAWRPWHRCRCRA